MPTCHGDAKRGVPKSGPTWHLAVSCPTFQLRQRDTEFPRQFLEKMAAEEHNVFFASVADPDHFRQPLGRFLFTQQREGQQLFRPLNVRQLVSAKKAESEPVQRVLQKQPSFPRVWR